MKNIKYSYLKFTVCILNNCRLPRQKVSLLTGVMLSKFKQLYCVQRNSHTTCTECNSKNICLVFNMMGRRFDKNMAIALQSSVSPKFIINCFDKRTVFKENDILEFEITIFDNLAELFVQYIYVFESIGQSGLGPEKAKYNLLFVSDEKGDIIYKNALMVENAPVNDIYTYISSRLNYCPDNSENFSKMTFLSPIMLNTNYVNDNSKKVLFIGEEALNCSLMDRLESLNILDMEEKDKLNELLDNLDNGRLINLVNVKVSKIRYYIKDEQRYIVIPAFTGYILFNRKNIYSYLEYFLACEKLCIGQNILLGFGRYIMGG